MTPFDSNLKFFGGKKKVVEPNVGCCHCTAASQVRDSSFLPQTTLIGKKGRLAPPFSPSDSIYQVDSVRHEQTPFFSKLCPEMCSGHVDQCLSLDVCHRADQCQCVALLLLPDVFLFGFEAHPDLLLKIVHGKKKLNTAEIPSVHQNGLLT